MSPQPGRRLVVNLRKWMCVMVSDLPPEKIAPLVLVLKELVSKSCNSNQNKWLDGGLYHMHLLYSKCLPVQMYIFDYCYMLKSTLVFYNVNINHTLLYVLRPSFLTVYYVQYMMTLPVVFFTLCGQSLIVFSTMKLKKTFCYCSPVTLLANGEAVESHCII